MAAITRNLRRAGPLAGLLRSVRWDPGTVISLLILLTAGALAIVGPVVAPYDVDEVLRRSSGASVGLTPPGAFGLLGTTNMGKDIFSQMIFGFRGALAVGGAAAISVVTIGLFIGLLAGYFRGWAETLLMRLVDIAYSLPLEPIAIVLLTIVSRSFATMVLAISLLAWRGPARVIRAQVLSVAQRPYIKAARIAGAGHLRILFLHILPDVLPMALMYLPISFGRAVLSEAAISFLGFGAPGMITWGQMLQQAFVAGAARTAWWWILAPGVCISAVVVSVFFVARSFEDSLDPRVRQS